MLSLLAVDINVVLAQFLCLAHWTLAPFLCLAQTRSKEGRHHPRCTAGAKKEKLLERLQIPNSREAEREDGTRKGEKPRAGSPSDLPGTAAQGQAAGCPWEALLLRSRYPPGKSQVKAPGGAAGESLRTSQPWGFSGASQGWQTHGLQALQMTGEPRLATARQLGGTPGGQRG